MRHRATGPAALLAVIALGGCANEATSTNGLAAPAPVRLTLKSSAIHGNKLPALYTCDGRNTWPPLSWGPVPSNVEEMALFALAPEETKKGVAAIKVEWGLGGIKATVHALRAGEIPPGAFLMKGSTGHAGYSICPPRGITQRYSFGLFALPAGARAGAEFPGPALLRNLNEPTRGRAATAVGFLTVFYKRR
ncbi:MAG TPA: hypothetical protein VIH71_06240 [Solirubrobacteraceae bacterium]